MMTQAERAETLARLLARYAPGDWEREHVEAGAGPASWADEEWFACATRREYGALRIEVALRGDGDVDIHFRIAGHEPDRVEAHYVVPAGEEADALDEVARGVGDFVEERIILGYDRSFVRGGRVFIPTAEIDRVNRRKVVWAVSWRGTYDWSL